MMAKDTKQLPAMHITDPEKLRLLLAESYEINAMLQARVDELTRRRFAKFSDEECWLWDDEGNNYLDSLVCPVVISPAVLKEIRETSEALVFQSGLTNSRSLKGVERTRRLDVLKHLQQKLVKRFQDSNEDGE